eukprot:11177127-Lingulodinium_polyedra.AAC.1
MPLQHLGAHRLRESVSGVLGARHLFHDDGALARLLLQPQVAHGQVADLAEAQARDHADCCGGIALDADAHLYAEIAK